MSRKSLKELFEEIDYSNVVERCLRRGYITLDQYKQLYPNNIIEDESQIERLLAKFYLEVGLEDGHNLGDLLDNLTDSFYGASLMLLEKKYPPYHNPPKYLNASITFGSPKNYSYKTVLFVSEVMTTGVSGGVSRILEDLVILFAESVGELTTRCLVDNFLNNLSSFEEEILVGEEYVNAYSKFLPSRYKKDKHSDYPRANFYLRDVLIEHPKMMFRLKDSLKRKDNIDLY